MDIQHYLRSDQLYNELQKTVLGTALQPGPMLWLLRMFRFNQAEDLLRDDEDNNVWFEWCVGVSHTLVTVSRFYRGLDQVFGQPPESPRFHSQAEWLNAMVNATYAYEEGRHLSEEQLRRAIGFIRDHPEQALLWAQKALASRAGIQYKGVLRTRIKHRLYHEPLFS